MSYSKHSKEKQEPSAGYTSADALESDSDGSLITALVNEGMTGQDRTGQDF